MRGPRDPTEELGERKPGVHLMVRGIGRLLPMAGDGWALRDAVVIVRHGRVAWWGHRTRVDAGLAEVWPGRSVVVDELNVDGACVVPGFIDPHTHLAWAGSRRVEFEARLAGATYDGGGIAATVAATTACPVDTLVEAMELRTQVMLSHGTTSAEVKTGYGLLPAEELRQLDAVLRLRGRTPLRIDVTYLAHGVPPGVDRAEHVAATSTAMVEAKRRGASWADVFCDQGAFTVKETRSILSAAKAGGLGLRMHADQLADTGAAQLAAELGCASADHLDRVTEAGAAALAAAGTIAVLAPTATLATRGKHWGYADRLREAGVVLALATDCNPGTSWCESMPYVIQLACLGLGLGVREAFTAATKGGARSLRRDDVGTLAPGARADLAILAAEHETDLVAHLGGRAVQSTIVGGRVV